MRLTRPVMWTGLPLWLSGEESACQCRRCRFDLWVGKIPLEKEMATHSTILARKNPTDGGAWRATVDGIAKESDTTKLLNDNIDVNQETFDFTPSSLSIKGAWILTQARWFFWGRSPPSSWFVGFMNKVVIPCPDSGALNYWPVVQQAVWT